MLQADSKEMYDAWIAALQKGIGAAFQRIHSIECSNNASGQSNHFNDEQSGNSISNHNNNKIKKIK